MKYTCRQGRQKEQGSKVERLRIYVENVKFNRRDICGHTVQTEGRQNWQTTRKNKMSADRVGIIKLFAGMPRTLPGS
jgi:hypothetical protein